MALGSDEVNTRPHTVKPFISIRKYYGHIFFLFQSVGKKKKCDSELIESRGPASQDPASRPLPRKSLFSQELGCLLSSHPHY